MQFRLFSTITSLFALSFAFIVVYTVSPAQQAQAADCFETVACTGDCSVGSCRPRITTNNFPMITNNICNDSNFIGSGVTCGVCFVTIVPLGDCGDDGLDACQ